VTYAELAERYGVPLCQGECAVKGHEKGFVARGGVHWRERRVTRLGLYRFLLLVAEVEFARVSTLLIRPGMGAWMRVQYPYALHMWAQKTAVNDLRVRFPRSFSSTRRALVRARMRDYAARGLPKPPEWERIHRWAAPE